MEEEKDAFYVVRKGDVVGIYKNLKDCQAQAGSSVCNPSVSVFKGYGLPKEAEEYLVSQGLKNATYSIYATDVQSDLFGKLVPCPFQQPASSGGKAVHKVSQPKRFQEVRGSVEVIGSASISTTPQKLHLKFDNHLETKVMSSICSSCILAFDGASKGNPGPAGAGAVLHAEDGSMVCRLREGLGTATNNVAEYRAVILGLKHALRKGFKHIRVRGDSNLVCMQIQGLWKIKNQNLAGLCKEANELKNKFISFHIEHVLRELNSEADTQANLAVNLKDGQIEEDCARK
ncbi:hypothetical protein P3X46_032474 [Hevea brasiliensis]|uniref:RNase H type-1 domain-containing protein n=1 Tax=Hevea brasiliensis TaxID=3981 RepID=A0ABQ9KDE6_HEVBR|nr:uncharacterized protein LOC110659227 [Hevea brasiliensis]XP_021672780.2 uncharacterized protein LOC110659227 [Hevea brasiliensis]XP_021672781.2 uncharacterized protein LOC110659227 [Hevea brasiliensis]KAJ9135268.1 hypothetical protein P3X46_032474 [Hevea brasiliensis]